MSETSIQRRLAIGAEPLGSGGVSFRVWAPKRQSVEVVFEENAAPPLALGAEGNGYFSGAAAGARPGMRYGFRLDRSVRLYPDPASRYQPHGPHGPSQIVDPGAFEWHDGGWGGIEPRKQVIYELHIGTFTPEGTWAAAMRELDYLADLGVTLLELMPIAEFEGRWGWGYDGVNLFAPYHHYGTADDLRRLVDAAHGRGLGVILDVVYNHFGPDGNYLPEFSDHYLSRTNTEWGASINFDDEHAQPVREFFIANARHWIAEYHFDGFRFDATHAIHDRSPRHILAEVAQGAREAAGARSIYLCAENGAQVSTLVRAPQEKGYGLDALWNDDFHHCARVAITGRREAYFTDYLGSAQELLSAAKYGYLYQGQRYTWEKCRRGTPALDLPPAAFVHYIQNHDQVANSSVGRRIHELCSAADYRAMTALLLLGPQTPLLFQGQEFAASSRFEFFVDHHQELSRLIREGRARELGTFPSVATPDMQAGLSDPGREETFGESKLRLEERKEGFHAQVLSLHKDLLSLRKTEPVLRRTSGRGEMDGAVLGPQALVMRFFAENPDDERLLLANFGGDVPLAIAPEPLLAPPCGRRWTIQWTSEDPKYGGTGVAAPDSEQEGWFIAGHCCSLLRPAPLERAIVESRYRKAGGG